MKIPHRKRLIPILVGLACTTASAQGNMDLRFAKYNICGSYHLVHINGITTTQTEAFDNLRRITTAYGNVYKEHPITYALVYNKTRGFPTDFYQSALQVISGYAGATWSAFYNAVQSGIYASNMSSTTTAKIAKTVDDLYGLTKPSPYADQDLEDMRVATLSMINKYSRVVFVPHSQGNLYTNSLVTLMTNAGISLSSIGVVGVAVPYPSVRTGNTYVTSSNDLVIDSVRKVLANLLLPQPLVANVTIPYQPTVDLLGHDFIGTYMANSTARGMITSRITSEFGGLKTTTRVTTFDPAYSFNGNSLWADCTGTPPYGPFPPTRPSSQCWYTWFEPIVSVNTAGNTPGYWRPGSPSEVYSIANAWADSCVAVAASRWSTYVATGSVTSVTGNCGLVYGDTDVRLAWRYNGYRSGDGVTTKVTVWPGEYYALGGTSVNKLPMCN